ncbi:hypothetical protein [Blastopirellula marina]|uniref:hypothetical protein n=1 Tax=Blastopirellula marina TaxID=124 RepID=UPI000CF99A3B|nr:hypothetical protein [Blastopirellula marina]
MYAACFLVTSAVLGVDYGYQVTDQEQLAYVVQIEPEAIESLKAGHPIEVGLPPDSERIQVFRVQIGKDELSKVVPATYQKPVKEIDPEVKLFPANNAILTAPPDPEAVADTKPSLGAEVAEYGPRSTYELPSDATSNARTGTNATGAAGQTGTSTSAYGEIPGAAARYGGGTSSNFSVPSPPGSPSTYGATQTSATAPVTGSTNGTTGTGSNPGSQYGSSSSVGTTGNTATGGTTASDNRYSNWNTSPSATGSTAGTTTNGSNPAGSPATGATGGTAADRFRYGGQQPNSSAGSNIVQPSSPSTGGWRNEVSTDLSGNSQSSHNTPGSQNPSGTQNNFPNNNNTAPPLMTGGSNYPNNNNQPPQTNVPNNNGTSGQNNEWLTWNNGLGGTSQPTSNQTPPPQYPQNPNPPNYSNQPQQNYPNNGNFNNGTVNNVPFQQGQGQYGSPGGYPPNQMANYNQPPYPNNANENSLIAYLAALDRLSGRQPQNGASTISSTNNTPSSRNNDEEEDERPSKTPPADKEIVREPPDWWQLLAVGFLISICLNGYMFMTSQDFRRKYQDLLEDVRDLRSLSND